MAKRLLPAQAQVSERWPLSWACRVQRWQSHSVHCEAAEPVEGPEGLVSGALGKEGVSLACEALVD